MRIRFFLACISASFVAAGFGIQACGGSADEEPVADSGVVEAAVEAGRKDATLEDVRDAAPACDPNKDFLKDIPDASIADGGSSTGLCLGCVTSKCQSEVKACANDCPCQDIAAKALECYAKSQNFFACVGQFAAAPQKTQDIGITLGGCVQDKCDDECAASAQTDGGDGG